MDFERVQTEIEAIPGNGPVLEALCRLLEEGEAIALVGAGASAGLWPLWDEFLDGFIAYGRRHGNISEDEAEFLRQEAASTPLETAQQLRNKLDEPQYFEYLHDTFRDKTSPLTKGAFTPTHQALLQLPVQNYLTLNYDAGLTNARAALYPGATTSYFFWDQEEARRILNRGSRRDVLHAHGRYDRAESIILTQDDYRKAYSPGPFLRLLNELFAYQKLLIVGFGLTDPYIKRLFDSIRTDYKQSPSQHIALVGLDEKDRQVTTLRRERVQMDYGARILFYPSRDHHRALTDWLTALAQQYGEAAGGKTAEVVVPLPVSPSLKHVVPDTYHHQPPRWPVLTYGNVFEKKLSFRW